MSWRSSLIVFMKLYFPSSFSGAMPWRISLLTKGSFPIIPDNNGLERKGNQGLNPKQRIVPKDEPQDETTHGWARPWNQEGKAQRRSSARPSVSGSSHGHEWYFLSCSTDLRIRTFHCLQTIVGHLQTNNGFDDRSKEKKENADNHPRRIVAEKRLTALDNPRTV